MGLPQVRHCIHGSRRPLGLPCQPKRQRSCPGPREGSRRRLDPDRQGEDISYKCTVSCRISRRDMDRSRALLTDLSQAILPPRLLRPGRPPLPRPRPRGRRIRHRIPPPRLQQPAAHPPGRHPPPHGTDLVLRPQGRGQRGPRPLHPQPSSLPRTIRPYGQRGEEGLQQMGSLLRPLAVPLF